MRDCSLLHRVKWDQSKHLLYGMVGCPLLRNFECIEAYGDVIQTLRIFRCITGVHCWRVSIKLGSTVLYLSVTTGNRTYVGYMYTEVTYNNAVVRVFVKILQDAIYEKKQLSLPLGRSHLHTLSHNRIGSDSSIENGKLILFIWSIIKKKYVLWDSNH